MAFLFFPGSQTISIHDCGNQHRCYYCVIVLYFPDHDQVFFMPNQSISTARNRKMNRNERKVATYISSASRFTNSFLFFLCCAPCPYGSNHHIYISPYNHTGFHLYVSFIRITEQIQNVGVNSKI